MCGKVKNCKENLRDKKLHMLKERTRSQGDPFPGNLDVKSSLYAPQLFSPFKKQSFIAHKLSQTSYQNKSLHPLKTICKESIHFQRQQFVEHDSITTIILYIDAMGGPWRHWLLSIKACYIWTYVLPTAAAGGTCRQLASIYASLVMSQYIVPLMPFITVLIRK